MNLLRSILSGFRGPKTRTARAKVRPHAVEPVVAAPPIGYEAVTAKAVTPIQFDKLGRPMPARGPNGAFIKKGA